MMKKIWMLISVFLFTAAVFADDRESIADIDSPEPAEKAGDYISAGESDGPDIRKGEGFDLRPSEVLIKGQIDTRVMLRREITSLEDLQDIKNILYEKEKIDIPGHYFDERDLAPKTRPAEKDFVGKMKIEGGTFNTLAAEGILGIRFDRKNNFVMRLLHENYDRPEVENTGRQISDNKNRGVIYYKTAYGETEAAYKFGATYNGHKNPMPSNVFGGEYFMSDIDFSAGLYGRLFEYDYSFLLKYRYFSQDGINRGSIYKENRIRNTITAERDFLADESKVKLVYFADYFISAVENRGRGYDGVFGIDTMVKGIFYFEPFVLHGGLRLQNFNMAENFYRLNPYFYAGWDFAPWAGVYAEFDPEMNMPSYPDELASPFVVVNDYYRVPAENASLKGVFAVKINEVYAEAYAGYKSVADGKYVDETSSGSLVFTYYNSSFDFMYYGLNLDIPLGRDLNFGFSYIYRHIAESEAGNMTYMPNNTLEAELGYDSDKWKAGISVKAESGAWGTRTLRLPAYALLNVKISREITDNLNIGGYINNVLNNENYLLYWYKEKGLNLGLGAEYNF
ncbi:MAG TPA: hypothetical protein ENN55_01895 [Firmicutes bacterium]|mgnify:CR=1 FL=1|nr:hypothetical protein [Bacillota bacterium]